MTNIPSKQHEKTNQANDLSVTHIVTKATNIQRRGSQEREDTQGRSLFGCLTIQNGSLQWQHKKTKAKIKNWLLPSSRLVNNFRDGLGHSALLRHPYSTGKEMGYIEHITKSVQLKLSPDTTSLPTVGLIPCDGAMQCCVSASTHG